MRPTNRSMPRPHTTYTLTGTSQSGEYHIGTHPDNGLRQWYRLVNGIDLADPEAHDERPAILVVDEGAAGVYDTVYVDLDFDYDFTDEKAHARATRSPGPTGGAPSTRRPATSTPSRTASTTSPAGWSTSSPTA